MKLSKDKKLMGNLAQGMKRKQVTELMAAAAPSFSQMEKEECQAPIHFLSALWKKQGTVEAFITELERLFKVCKYTHLIQIIHDFKQGHSNDALCQPTAASTLASIQGRIEHFRKLLIELSRIITKVHLEIMIELADLPEMSKECISSSLQLFEEMERYGKISKNDVELLQEMFHLLQLAKEKELLLEYATKNVKLESVVVPDHPSRIAQGIEANTTPAHPSYSSCCGLTQSSPAVTSQCGLKERKRKRDLENDNTAQSPPAKAAAILPIVYIITLFPSAAPPDTDHQG